ncbi:uncharacterized protein [Nicotiana sylvestris]
MTRKPVLMEHETKLVEENAYKRNRSSQIGKILTYIPPDPHGDTIVVTIVDEDIKEHQSYWSNSLIGYVPGENPYFKSMENYVDNVWDFVNKSKILCHVDGYYIFRFDSMDDRDRVIQLGPYTFHYKSFILMNWSIDFVFDLECLNVIPLWVRFPNLTVGYWSTEVLSKLASVVGKPMYTDLYTIEMDRISFARVLVEADSSHPLPSDIELHTPVGIIHQSVEYD